MRNARLPLALATVLISGAAVAEPAARDCQVGAYRLADSSVIDIAPSGGDTLRWRKWDGTSGALHPHAGGDWTSTYGWTDRADGKHVSFAPCPGGDLVFDGLAGRRIVFDVTETTFHGQDVDLAGRLILPHGSEPVPIAVLLHGGEHDSARETFALQRLLPAAGVGAFVYDKRGTGGSGGQYSQDFTLLAADAVAALHETRRLAGARVGRIGYHGGSQGGWIAPLAAARESVDFVVVAFGLAVSVIDEDQEEVALEMSLEGHSPEVIARALKVADAAEAVIASRFTSGFEHLDALRAQYRDEPWYPDIHGNYTWMLLSHSSDELRRIGKDYVWGTPFHYDPMPTLRSLAVPQLWILGTDDLEAPSAETSRRLRELAATGHPVTLALYPRAEHGLTEYEFDSRGERVSTRYVAGYFAMLRDYMRDGRLGGSYGDSVITRPAPRAAAPSGDR